jgi:Ala-tRNA(Pro) deacylase
MHRISTIDDFLREAHVAYVVLPHPPAFTAWAEAAAAHVAPRDWAKVVVCILDGEPIQAVVPASSFVNLERLLALADGIDIRLADEQELQRLFPDCELGAMPPLGPFYGQTVYVDAALAMKPDIVFSAGTHRHAMAIEWNDFVKMVNPIIGSFAE